MTRCFRVVDLRVSIFIFSLSSYVVFQLSDISFHPFLLLYSHRYVYNLGLRTPKARLYTIFESPIQLERSSTLRGRSSSRLIPMH
jgi:hypothetical protein